MVVAVVNVGVMRVAVDKGRVPVRMRVGLAGIDPGIVLMLVVFVVAVHMIVFERLVLVLVNVQFGQVQPEADTHQRGRAPECQARPLREHEHRDDCAGERRRRKIGAGPRCAKVA